MLGRRCGLCSQRVRKINIVLGGREENVTKTLKNRILLPSVSTLVTHCRMKATKPLGLAGNKSEYLTKLSFHAISSHCKEGAKGLCVTRNEEENLRDRGKTAKRKT